MVLQAENSPLTQEQAELLNRVLPSLQQNQLTWLTGYLSGVAVANPTAGASAPQAAPASAEAAPGSLAVTVLYGTQTGNSYFLAEESARRLRGHGFAVTVENMAKFKVRALKKLDYLLVIVSTHGEGDPPDSAMLLHESLYSKKAPEVPELKYSVLALGDISYEQFCKTGRDFDERLAELGATRLAERQECDLDFEEPAMAWMELVTERLAAEAPAEPSAQQPLSEAGGPAGAGTIAAPGAPGTTALAPGAAQQAAPAYSRFNPFQAEVLENAPLNAPESDKETQHLEISLEDSGLGFEPGDSIGIYPRNHTDLVDELIATMRWSPEEPVAAARGTEMPLREALRSHYEITVLTRPLLESASAFGNDALSELVREENDARLREYILGRDLLDLATDFELPGAPAADFVKCLRRIPPRLYSIASSYSANPDEVHLAIAAVRYSKAGRDRNGVFSVHCAEKLEAGDTLPIYVHSNPAFRMPKDPNSPVIMIGPGTGVAPFRAFLEEREEHGAGGRSWLFYGDRRFHTDFLYQVDWQRWLDEGVLTRMDVAFSRDGCEKDYVQHRLLDQSRELFSWIEDGAHIYVCGDEQYMAPDVHAALETIVAQEGGMSEDRAKEYVARLSEENRYQRDVY